MEMLQVAAAHPVAVDSEEDESDIEESEVIQCIRH